MNAPAARVVGLSFEIDSVPVAGLRVEFPTASRDPQTTGWDYWGANSVYPPSPVTIGENRVIFSEVRSPVDGSFDTTRVTGVQFHVPTGPTSATQYSFCISDVRLLRN